MARRNALVLVAASILPLAPTVNASAHELTVRVQNVQPARSGNIVIEIWRRDEFESKFPESVALPPERTNGARGEGPCRWPQPSFTLCRIAVPATSAAVSKTIKDLPDADFAISVYHDANRNWTLDLRMGNAPRPLEGVGASNNGRKFNDAVVPIKKDAAISIMLFYPRDNP